MDFAVHDEIVLVQSLDLFGAQRDGRVTPAETDVGVMSFGFGKLADPLHEGERFPEIAKSKRAIDAAGLIAQFPLPGLDLETQSFITPKRRGPPPPKAGRFLRPGVSPAGVFQ